MSTPITLADHHGPDTRAALAAFKVKVAQLRTDAGDPLVCDDCGVPIFAANLGTFVTHDYLTDGCDCVVGAYCKACAD